MENNNSFELHGLQKLFATPLSTLEKPGFLFNPDVIREFVLGEVDRIKHRFLEKGVTIDGKDAIRRYVRVHQYSLVAIMDRLYQRGEEHLALTCYDALEGLLLFLQERFPAYFDERGKAPLKEIYGTCIDIAASIPLLKRDLLRISDFDVFVYMILCPLERFASAPASQKISFHRVRHIRYILEHARKVGNDGIKGDFDEPLIRLIVYLNYNSRMTFAQLRNFLDALLPSDLETTDKICTLEGFLKIVIQAPVKPGTGYHPHVATLKRQLTEYLTTELNSLGKIQEREEG
jgi:hypothetical protein